MTEFVNHTAGDMVGKGEPIDYIHGHYGAMALRGLPETMQARRRRTQKQGPYKAGATLKAKAVAKRIEQVLNGRTTR